MITTKKKIMSYVLSFIMAFTVFGVLGVSQVKAASEPVFKVTVTYEKAGAQDTSATIHEYTQEELDALADVGDDELYMWQNNKGGTFSANVYRVKSGIKLETLLADNNLSAGDTADVRMWEMKDGNPSLYTKFTYKNTILGTNYVYPDAKYEVAEGAASGQAVYGDPVEVKPVLALDYLYSVGGLVGNPNVAAKDIDDFDVDQNRVFTGMTGTTDFGGMKSISGPIGMDVLMEADGTVELLSGETVNFISDDNTLPVELPVIYGDKLITGWSYLSDTGQVVDLGLVTTGAQLAAAGDATIFPTPKTADDVVMPPAVTSVKAVVAKKAMTVKFTSEGDAAGYQIHYKVKGTSKWKTATAATTSKKIKGLKKGKKYQVQVRGFYYTPKQAKEYGEWSKTITTKKIK